MTHMNSWSDFSDDEDENEPIEHERRNTSIQKGFGERKLVDVSSISSSPKSNQSSQPSYDGLGNLLFICNMTTTIEH